MSDARLRAAERAYREDMSDASESAYWEAWIRWAGSSASPPRRGSAPPPWHVRCPSVSPRAGDMLVPTAYERRGRAARLALGQRDGSVIYIKPNHQAGLLLYASPHAWLRWCRDTSALVHFFAARNVPADACWRDRLIQWACDRLDPVLVVAKGKVGPWRLA